MKKIETLTLIIGIYFLLSITSCTKNKEFSRPKNSEINIPIPEITFSYTIINGILVFDTEADYEAAINYLVKTEKTDTLDQFNNMLNYESYRSKFLNNATKMKIVKDELFASIINPDCIFGIDNFLFKMNFIDENIDVYYFENCDKLKSIGIDEYIGKFSFNDDVISILKGEEQLKSSYCDYKTQNCSLNYTSDGGEIEIMVFYIKLGVYNTVKAKIKQTPINHRVNIELNGDFSFSNRNQSGSSTKSIRGTSNSLIWRPYAKMKRLKNYKAEVSFFWDCGNPYECVQGMKLINECNKICKTE